MSDLLNNRREYKHADLKKKDLFPDPFEQFSTWFQEATKAMPDVLNTMCLSTANPNGRPSSRIVLLKHFDKNGFVFFTNYKSRKGNEIKSNPYASLLFFWHNLQRQIRLEGKVEKTTSAESDIYFKQRPTESRIGAWASSQSHVIPDRKSLEKNVENYKNRFKNKTIIRPSYWGGYRLVPDKFEFWQERGNRLHDRFIYTKRSNFWDIERIAP